jgi:hypothetical protein
LALRLRNSNASRLFLQSIAWAMVTVWAVLYKQSYGKDVQERLVWNSEGIAQVDPWLPRFDNWNKEYNLGSLDIPVLDILKLEDANTPKVVMLDCPPPLSLKCIMQGQTNDGLGNVIWHDHWTKPS